jgi:hypothetical protein
MTKGEKHSGFRVGDSVVVKPGVTDQDFGVDLGAWQGTITDIHTTEREGICVAIRWDSVTLKNMPASAIEQCKEQGLSWTEYVLLAGEVERTIPRVTEQDAEQITADLAKQYAWSHLGEQGRRIRQVLASMDPDDEVDDMYAWEEYLTEHLSFPFEAEVDEAQDRGPLRDGDRLKVTGISLLDELYGVIVDVWRGRRKYAFHLCDLAVVDERSPNHQLVKDYRVWFANR